MITPETVRHVAQLARLALTESEEQQFTDQLGAILDHVAQLATVETAGVVPTAHPLPVSNVTRADEPRASLPREEVLANAPAPEQGMFRVPKILSE